MGGSVVYLHRHEGRAPRGTILMGQDVTGMDRASLTALVLQRAASASLTLTVDGTPTTVPLTQIAQVDARATRHADVGDQHLRLLGLQRGDGLFSWKWSPNTSDPVPDKNNAADGDILIAWALMRERRSLRGTLRRWWTGLRRRE